MAEAGGARSQGPWWFQPLWGLTILSLWGAAFLGPIGFVLGVASFFTDTLEGHFFGEHPDSWVGEAVYTTLMGGLGALGIAYVASLRRKAALDLRIKHVLVLVVLLGIPAIIGLTRLVYDAWLLTQVRRVDVTITAYDAETREPVAGIVLSQFSAPTFARFPRDVGVAAIEPHRLRIQAVVVRPLRLQVGAEGYQGHGTEVSHDQHSLDLYLDPVAAPGRGKQPPG